MHLVVIGWLYVALMMAVAEATNTNGTVLGAIFTFLLYGLAPVALVVYLMATPARRRALKERETAAREAAIRAASSPSVAPDAGGETAADAVAPVREEK
jgi:heme exporter protein D